MEPKKIFKEAKEFAKEKGKYRDKSDYDLPGLCGDSFSAYGSEYTYRGKGFTIIYFKGEFGDGSGKKEEVNICSRLNFMGKKKKVYSFFRKVGSDDEFEINSWEDWKENFEKLVDFK